MMAAVELEHWRSHGLVRVGSDEGSCESVGSIGYETTVCSEEDAG